MMSHFVRVHTPDTFFVIASASEAIPALPAGGSRDRHSANWRIAMTSLYQKSEQLLHIVIYYQYPCRMIKDEHYRLEKHWNVPLIMMTFLFVFLLYAGLNYWIYLQARAQSQNNQTLTPVPPTQQPLQTALQSSTPSAIPTSKTTLLSPTPTKTVIQQLIPTKVTPTANATTVTPNPTPQTYACDPSGVCGVYENTKEKGCPQTFQDPKCSNQCTQPDKRCKI